MTTEFEQQYLMKTPPRDEVYEWYLERWIKYHRECEKFDRKLCPPHGIRFYGYHYGPIHRHAAKVFKRVFGTVPFAEDLEENQRAKLEALRIVKREFKEKE